MATAAGTPKATRHATAYNAAWVDSMVQLAAACDIDAECRRAEASGPSASVPPPAVTKLVGEVSACLSLLLGRGPPATILPDTTIMQAISALANRAPYLFRLPTLTAGLLAFMGSDRAAASSSSSASASSSASVLPTTVLKRKSPQLAVLAVTILDAAYRTLPADHPWPLSFVRVLLEDYFDLRNWVENDAAAGFIRTITHAFRDWTPPDTAREKNDREESDGDEEIIVEESGDTVMVDAPPVASASTASAGAASNSSSAASAASGVGPSPRAALSVPSSSMPMIPLGAIGRGSSLGASSGGGLMRNTSSAAGSKDAKQQPLIPRYQQQSLADEIRLMVERAFAIAIKGIFPPGGGRTGPNQIPPHFLRFLSISLGYRSLRHFTLLNIDAWLSHSMSNRAAKRLLVIVAEELHKAAILPSNATSFDTVNVLTIPTKTPWADLGANMATFSPETLHAWSRTSSPSQQGQVIPIDLQSLRLFFQLGLKVKSNMSAAGGGGGLAASNAFWDSAYFQGLQRIFRGATNNNDHGGGGSATPSSSINSSSTSSLLMEPPHPSPLLPVVVWKAAFHSWIAQDWQTAASSLGWQQGVSQQTSSHHSASSGPSTPATPPLLYAPTHFILKCVDLFLQHPPPGGLLPALSSYILSILDKAEYMHRIQFVLRRAMWMNTMYAYSNSNGVAPTPTSGAATAAASSSSTGGRPSSGFQSTGVAPTIYLDLFSLSKRLLDYTLYAAVPHCVLRPTKEPRLTDEQGRPVAASEAPPAILQQHAAEVARYHARRETIVTEMVNLVTWCCIVTSQPVVLLQNLAAPGHHQGNGSSGRQPHHHPTAASSTATSDLSSSLLPSQRLAAADSSLQVWRFSVASIQAKALAWIQNWLLGFLETQPAATTSSSAAGAAETPLPPAIKDATLLFSDALTSLLFLHTSVHQFLQPFLGSSSAPISLISMPTSRSLVSSSSSSGGGGPGSGFFLSDVWPLDQSFLKKAAAGLLLDRLPLLEDTIARLVMISLSNPTKLPHAHTIQILELLLRRVCQLALAVGKKYETNQSESTRTNHHHNSNSSHHPLSDPSDDDPPPRGILRIQNDGLLESILQLSQFPTPIPPPAPPGQTHPPLLAQSALFWRSCVLLVILSAFNPHTIGRRSWEQVPTLRCLLEMVVSEIWLQYSPAGGPPSQPTSLSALYPPFPDLISKSLLNHKVAIELDAILFVENLLPDNRVAPGQKATPRTRETSLYISHGYLMLLDPSEILRRPPEHILQTIHKLVGDFGLGTRLRSSRNPNFLANMLSRQMPENYVRWTRNLVLSDPTTMEIMPMGALAELVLHATERVQFQTVPSVLNGTTPIQPMSPSDHREATRRKSRAVSRQHSVNGGGAAVAHPAANTPAVVDPLLHHLPAMYAVLRRLLPTIDVMYGPTTTTTGAAGSPSTVEESRASILSVLSPKLGPTRHASSAPAATPATPLTRVRPTIDGGEESPRQPSPPPRSSPPFQLPTSSSGATSGASGFDHVAFLEVLSMFLARLTSRTPCVRRAAAHGLHFWLCAESLPSSLDGVERRGACCEPARHFDQLGSEATPALPPATCWLKYFFLSFLHATDTPATTPSAPSFSLAFLTAGRLVIRKLCTVLMCALEVESDPDTLFGYISFLHATATRFSYSPTIPPSKLFGLDLALRVCDVVLAREIVADKLLAPIAHTAEASVEALPAEGTAAAASSSDEDSRSKKRKLGHSRSAASNGESSMVDAGSDTLPMLDLDASAMPQLFTLDPARTSPSASPTQVPGAGYALVSIFSSQAYANGATRTASPSLDDDKLHRCTLYSGYALVVSVLSAAFGVVEYMQEDEKFIRRMLQREQKKADRMHLQGLTMPLSVPDSSPPTPMRATPQLKRSRSQMEEEDLDEAEEELAADESDPTAGVQPTEMRRRYSGANEDALMTEDPLNQSQTAESVDEDFVTLHRSWPTCAQPILAYVPLPLLHGIVSFLASPYALPPPTPSGEDSASRLMLQLSFDHYQHLLTLLLPPSEGPTGHAVSLLASESLPTLPIKAGASWMTDFSGIQWPMPSELQADHFLEQSTTPMLLLLAIEVCSPIQLLAALTRFGLADTLLERIFTKLDAWANYQVRLSQRQTPPATATTATTATTIVQGGMTKSSSSTSLSLTPAMRELILQLPKILHYVRLYQSTMKVDRPEADDIVQPGAALLAYLESLAPVPATVPRAVSPPAPSSDGLVGSIRLLLANAPDVSPSLRVFQRVYQLAQGAPGDFFQLVLAAVDGAHCDLSHLAPLVQLAVASLSVDQLRLAHAFCSQLAVGLQALKGSSREKSAYIHHDMACAELEQWSEWADQRAAQMQAALA